MEKCPYCERKFTRIQDFPIIQIMSFEKLEFPEITGSQFSEIFFEKKLKAMSIRFYPV